MISSKNYVQRFDFILEVKARGLVLRKQTCS